MKRIIYLAIIACLFISCENEIPFDVKENQPKLILNALLNADKEENEIILAFTGRNETSPVEDASVDIYINGVHKEHLLTPDELSSGGYWISGSLKTHLRFLPDDTIKIEARTNDGKHYAWAEVVVPHPVAIEKVDTSLFETTSWRGTTGTHLRTKTTFTDDIKQANYYRIIMEGYLEFEAKEFGDFDYKILNETFATPPIISEDVVLTDGRPSVEEEQGILTPVENYFCVFDDSRINGTYTMTTSLFIPYYHLDYYSGYGHGMGKVYDVKRIGISVKVKLLSLSKDYYLYLKAANITNSDTYIEYFNLPVKLPSNVNGGTGIVGVSVGSEITIPLEDYVPR